MGLDMYAYAVVQGGERDGKKNHLPIGASIIACMVGWKNFGKTKENHTKAT